MIKLMCGLGNPGMNYSSTRHNAGRWLINAFSHQLNTTPVKEKKGGYWCSGDIDGNTIYFFESAAYMNECGKSIADFARYYKIKPEEILIAYDELALAPGIIKLKQGGGSNGHNGIKDCIKHFENPMFYRLKIGIGRPFDASMTKHYVLKSPSVSEKDLICDAIDEVVPQLPLLGKGHFQPFMHNLHTR